MLVGENNGCCVHQEQGVGCKAESMRSVVYVLENRDVEDSYILTLISLIQSHSLLGALTKTSLPFGVYRAAHFIPDDISSFESFESELSGFRRGLHSL